jgi:amino acid transporter
MCFGEFAGYLCGCNLGLELTISAAAVARGWTSYVATLFRAAPDALRLRIGGGGGEGDGDGENTAVRMMLLDVPAAAIVAGITWMLIRGMKDTARFNTVVTVVSLIVIGFVIVAGGAEVDSNNWYAYCNLILVCARAIRLTYSVLFQDPVRAQRSRRRPRRRVRRVLQLRGVRYRRDVRGGVRQPGS